MNRNDKQKREVERLAEKRATETIPLGGAARALLDANGFDTSKNPTPEQAKAQDAAGGDAHMGSEARIQALQAEVERLRGELSRARSQERSDLQRDIDRARADAKAFRADLVALDEVARGGPGKDLPVTTEMGRHLMGSIQELLRVIDMRREQALAHATPVSGWSSPRAKELVEKVPTNQRELLLGDLLADLAFLAGETGKNETAQDVLSRRVHEAAKLRQELEDLQKKYDVLAQHHRAEREQVLELQAAMVAKRSPDAGAGATLEQIGGILAGAAGALDGPGILHPSDLPALLERMLREWLGLRELLGKTPMTAVAVRDDSTPALAERYALMVLRWDGAKLDFEMVDGPARPWVDLARPMRHAVDTKLVPSTFR